MAQSPRTARLPILFVMEQQSEALGATLRAMYRGAERGDQVAMIHLFGIMHAREIKNCDATPADYCQNCQNT